MVANILDGKALGLELQEALQLRVKQLIKGGTYPNAVRLIHSCLS